MIALLPFATLVAGFLLLRMSALRTAALTCLVEFLVVISYYHASAVHSIEAGLWGNLTMWSVFILLWSGQIFGQTFRATGLIPVLLDSFGSIVPAKDKQGRAMTMVALLSGFVGTFNLYAVYPVAIPALAELGFDGVQSASGYLIYASWCIPFAGLFIGAVIAGAATSLSVAEIARASGLLTIPLVFVSVFGTYRILGIRLSELRSQALFLILTLSHVAGIVLFTQIWPQYHVLTLMSGATIALVLLIFYGRSKRLQAQSSIAQAAQNARPGIAEESPTVPAYSFSTRARAYVPLLFAIAYAILARVDAVASRLARFEFHVAAWGFSPVKINIFTAPALPLLIAIASCYFFRLKEANLLNDFVRGTKHGASSLSTLLFGSATVYLMADTKQITFLGEVLAGAGRTVYQLLDSGLIFLGGMTFGQGAPAVLLFSRMQMSPVKTLGLPLVLLVGLVNLVAMGPTNAVKPSLIRFAASLVNVEGRDRDIFRTGLYWGVVQIVVTTAFLMLLIYFWK